MFNSFGIDENDDMYHVMIFTLQGPFPDKFADIAENITLEHLHGIEELVIQRGGKIKYENTLAAHFNKETSDFLHKLMKLDPRNRLSAQEILQNEWLSDIKD